MFKRKKSVDDEPEFHWLVSHSADSLDPAQSLCVEAHEADLVNGKEAFALTLETPVPGEPATSATPSTGTGTGTRGSALIKWVGSNGGDTDIWVDRFDARLLLSELPVSCLPQSQSQSQSQSKAKSTTDPGSPVFSSGWSDLPSDTEDAFFLSPSEIADVRYTKRRRLLEDARTERLAALRAAAGDDSVTSAISEDVDVWGGSDEEPDAAQLQLMDRTAAHLYASPDRTRLMARILANHGADRRFAFLRGRWRRAWLRAQARAVSAAAAAAEKEEERKKGEKATGTRLVGLADYGDSDEDEEESEEGNEGENDPEPAIEERTNEEAKIEARRARAREWAAKRRAEKAESSANSTTQ